MHIYQEAKEKECGHRVCRDIQKNKGSLPIRWASLIIGA